MICSPTLLKIIAPDASIHVRNAPKSLAAGAPPQTPLWELTCHWWNPWHITQNHCIYVKNAPKLLASEAPPQTPLGELTCHWWNPWHITRESLRQMLPVMSKMHQNRWRLGAPPQTPLGELICHWWNPWHITQNHCICQNRWRLGLRLRSRWGSL